MKAREAARILESAYRFADDLEGWMSTLLASMAPVIERGAGVQGHVFDVARPGVLVLGSRVVETIGTPSGWSTGAPPLPSNVPPALVDAIYCNVASIETARNLAKHLPLDAYPEFQPFEVFAHWGMRDAIGIVPYDPVGGGITIMAPSERVLPPFDRGELRRWRMLNAHLLAGLRAQRALEPPDAILDPTGRVVAAHGTGRTRSAREALRDHALEIDRARAVANRDPERALRVWSAMLGGGWSLVDRFESDGRRYLIARRIDPASTARRRLSDRERQVAAHAAHGHSNDHIAYMLGLSPSTVSSHLRAALRRLGVHNVAGLAEIFGRANDESEAS
jgi:DNA-binding CsgD family transcriptional regulator